MSAPPKEIQRARNYKRVFLGNDGKPTDHGERVLADLRHFCFGDRATLRYSPTTGVLDPVASAAAAARQEVFFRIVKALGLNEIEYMALRERIEPEDSE